MSQPPAIVTVAVTLLTTGLAGASSIACGGDPAPADTEDTTSTGGDSSGPPLGACTAARAHCLDVDGGATNNPPPPPPPPPTPTSTDGGSETGPPIPDLPDSPPFPSEFDCDDAPLTAQGYQRIDGARGYHGLAITWDGLILGSDGSSLIESSYDGAWGVFVPGIGNGQQMDWLPNGDLAHATDDNAITRIRLDGTTEVISAGVNAYGVRLGSDNQLYIASDWGGANQISRIDHETGAIEVLLTGNEDEVHSIGFSPDGQRLYVGTIGSGAFYYVDLDAEMNPTSELQIFSPEVGEGWHDAVAVDACGYIYVPDFWSRNIYRISPTGEATVFYDPPDSNDYAHGLIWGTGEFGWRIDALYFPQPYNSNTVGEIVVGVPPAGWDGTVLNVPEPL